jgi:hypothetical protein
MEPMMSESSNVQDRAKKSKLPKVDPLLSVAKRNREIEKRLQWALTVVALQMCGLILLIGAVVYLSTRPVVPVYFVQKADGSGLERIYPLNEANTSTSAVTQLVADQIGCVNSYDFANYKNQLARCGEFFTRTGWTRFLGEFEAQGMRLAIEQRALVASSVIGKPPKIVKQGEIMGALYWDLEVPFSVRYQGRGYDTVQNSVAVVKVVRVPVTDNPRGIAVAQVGIANGGG